MMKKATKKQKKQWERHWINLTRSFAPKNPPLRYINIFRGSILGSANVQSFLLDDLPERADLSLSDLIVDALEDYYSEVWYSHERVY